MPKDQIRSGSTSGGVGLGRDAPESQGSGASSSLTPLAYGSLRALSRLPSGSGSDGAVDRLERDGVEARLLQALRGLVVGAVAVAGGPLAPLRPHRAARLAREALHLRGVEHAPRLDDRALLRRARSGQPPPVPRTTRGLHHRGTGDPPAG